LTTSDGDGVGDGVAEKTHTTPEQLHGTTHNTHSGARQREQPGALWATARYLFSLEATIGGAPAVSTSVQHTSKD
jgi:hypothetical protein